MSLESPELFFYFDSESLLLGQLLLLVNTLFLLVFLHPLVFYLFDHLGMVLYLMFQKRLFTHEVFWTVDALEYLLVFKSLMFLLNSGDGSV